MKKALIIGVTGQDGSYLSEFLLNKGYKVYGLIRRSSSPNTHRIDHIFPNSVKDKNKNKLVRLYGDITDSTQIMMVIKKYKPDEVYNLAAQSHVRVSFEIPEYTYDVVGIGPLRVLEAIKNINPKIKYLQASSSEMFGNSKKVPQNEETPFNPESPYASAKVLGYYTTVNYRKNFGIFACNSIMFNHESPQRNRPRIRNLRPPRRPRLALLGELRGLRPGAGALPAGRAGVGAGNPARGVGDPDEATRFIGGGNPVGPPPRPARSARHARRVAPRGRTARPEEAAHRRPVQARLRAQPGHPGALPGQPAPRGATGALLPPQREQYRSRPVPQRPPGGHGGAEDRLHPEGRGRHRSVSLRPGP